MEQIKVEDLIDQGQEERLAALAKVDAGEAKLTTDLEPGIQPAQESDNPPAETNN